MMPRERYKKLKEYLSVENPVLLDVIDRYRTLDEIAYSVGLLDKTKTYTEHISWWPMISILGTFSAGKSTFINEYLGTEIQESGNQAIDDKFTVVCYGDNTETITLPGLALDADPRFPFYNISEEVNKVDPGEGNRVNLYLQLKTLKSQRVKGKILIDAIKDTSGDIQYNVYSADGHLRLGGKPAHGHITWDPVIPLTFKGSTYPPETVGIEGDKYIVEAGGRVNIDKYTPTSKAGDTHFTISDANALQEDQGWIKTLSVVPDPKRPGKLKLAFEHKNNMGTHPLPLTDIAAISILGITFSFSDMNVTDLNESMFIEGSKDIEDEIIKRMEIANKPAVVEVRFLEELDQVFTKTQGIWFKNVSQADISTVGALTYGIAVELEHEIDPYYREDVIYYLKGSYKSHGGQMYVANKQISDPANLSGHVGPWKAADWDLAIQVKAPTTDGEYKLKILNGVATWVTI